VNHHTSPEVARMLELSARLRDSRRVRQLAKASNDPEALRAVAGEAAHALVDIQRSCDVLCAQLVPKLTLVPPNSQDFEDVLDAIAEEFRHIHYHIVNTRLFNYAASGRDMGTAG